MVILWVTVEKNDAENAGARWERGSFQRGCLITFFKSGLGVRKNVVSLHSEKCTANAV